MVETERIKNQMVTIRSTYYGELNPSVDIAWVITELIFHELYPQ